MKQEVSREHEISSEQIGPSGTRVIMEFDFASRIGDYRVVLKIADKEITIFAICHRKDVYQRVLKRTE
ncbi:MAG: hypothetical protein HN368_11915 [Spirochaetales bacterium]|nr:hypothetical protein [Spirochaetales bacterium]